MVYVNKPRDAFINVISVKLESVNHVDSCYCLKCREERPVTMFQRWLETENKRISAKKQPIATNDSLIVNIEDQILLWKKEVQNLKSKDTAKIDWSTAQ